MTVASRTKLTVVTPAHVAGTVDIRVTTKAGTSAIVAADRFVYAGVPVITGYTGVHGPTQGGEDALLTGTGFVGPLSVKLDGVPIGHIDFHGNGTVEIEAQMPAHAEGTVKLTVTAVGGTSAPVTYTYVGKPVIRLTPATGPADTAITTQIRGTGLAGLSSISVDGVAETGPIFIGLDPNGNYVLLGLDPHPAGSVQIRVTTWGGTSDPVPFTFS